MEEIETDNNKINKFPFLTIWFRPRKTIRHLLQRKANKSVWIIAVLLGILFVFQYVHLQHVGMFLPGRSLQMISIFTSIGIVVGPLLFIFFSFLYYWIGSKLGGKGSWKEIRVVYAWSSFPKLLKLPIWIILLINIGICIFGVQTPYMDLILRVSYGPFFSVLYNSIIVTFLWTNVLMILNLIEVHKLPAWKAILTVILLLLTEYLVLLLLGSIISYRY